MTFSHINELIAFAPITESENDGLFIKESVEIIDNHAIRWTFILYDGRDIHFQEEIQHLDCSDKLNSFKHYIKQTLRRSNENINPCAPFVRIKLIGGPCDNQVATVAVNDNGMPPSTYNAVYPATETIWDKNGQPESFATVDDIYIYYLHVTQQSGEPPHFEYRFSQC
ncbi:TPA: hypothetical protein U2I61_000870 [Providencia rettgeri]|nr:hypothetical protein [Providencia rettgeri]